MIFNEIAYQELLGRKLAAVNSILANRYKEINTIVIPVSDLSDEAKMAEMLLRSGQLQEKDVEQHLLEEISKDREKHKEYIEQLSKGDVKLPSITEEEIKMLIPSMEEILTEATITNEEILGKIKEMSDGKK